VFYKTKPLTFKENDSTNIYLQYNKI